MAAAVRKTALVCRLQNNPGALEAVLRVFRERNVNLTRIESRPRRDADFDVFLDIDSHVVPTRELNALGVEVSVLPTKHVPFFPRRIQDLDNFSQKVLDAGEELQSDHPGFSDVAYRRRRSEIVNAARSYRHGDPLPRVQYDEAETSTWRTVYEELKKRYENLACEEYNELLSELESEKIYSPHAIPQLGDIEPFLRAKTNFRLRPVGGLLSSRDFLNGLAFRTFHATQYIRHPSRPLYTPEPDVVHELMGHVVMLGNREFADLSQEIGLASLGARDADIKKIATLYWFSVEFGVVMQRQKRRRRRTSTEEVDSDKIERVVPKAYGAGLLSSFGEMEYACGGGSPHESRPSFEDFVPEVVCETPYPITTFQPKYFTVPSLAEAARRIREFCAEDLRRPFYADFDPKTQRVFERDRAIRRVGSASG